MKQMKKSAEEAAEEFDIDVKYLTEMTIDEKVSREISKSYSDTASEIIDFHNLVRSEFPGEVGVLADIKNANRLINEAYAALNKIK